MVHCDASMVIVLNDCCFLLDLERVLLDGCHDNNGGLLRGLLHFLNKIVEVVLPIVERECDLLDLVLLIQSIALGYLMTPHDA